MENAENTISEPLDFKIFRGRMPKTPIQTRASRARLQGPHFNKGSAVPDFLGC